MKQHERPFQLRLWRGASAALVTGLMVLAGPNTSFHSRAATKNNGGYPAIGLANINAAASHFPAGTVGSIAQTKLRSINALPPQIALPLQDDTTIKIDTNLVVLNVTVTDSQGRRITQLKAADFRLEDEGKSCVISHFVTEEAPFAVVILIDASESMQAKLSRAKVAAAHFAEVMRPDDVISVVSFHDKVEQVQDFSASHDLDIQDIEAQGKTKLYDGLLQGINLLAGRPEQRRAVVLISDGADTSSSANSRAVLTRALEIGTTIYAVDISDDRVARSENLQNSGILKDWADKTGGRYLRTPGGLMLQTELQHIAEELRNQYTLGFYPDKTAAGRTAKLQRVKLSLTNARPAVVRTRQGYYPPVN